MLKARARSMSWLQAIDTALFRFVNQSLANPVLDWLMPGLAGHSLFVPVLLVLGVWLVWKGGRRGRLFVLFLALVILLGDSLVCNTIKTAVGRPRPCVALADARKLIGCSGSGSMPSGHAANWFAAAMVCFIFYRRSWRVMLPAAATVAFSRVYNGVHYPSDVVAGGILGAGYAAAGVWSADALWRWAGRKWFPLWWRKLPSLMLPDAQVKEGLGTSNADLPAVSSQLNQHWLRFGYVLIAAILLFRLCYIASAAIELSQDEAYQWLWSKHLALSYYSKPLGIAFIQFAGTALWGDTELGVRFFSPVFAAVLSLVMLRFMAREVGARQGFLLLVTLSATPLMAVGTVLMTIDPPLVFCWTLAMVAGWRAAQPTGTTRHWLLVGAAMGLGFLSKYSAAYQIVCWMLFFALWKPARVHLRKPGPYLAVLVFAICTLPVLIWNAQHEWITATHVAQNASLDKRWRPMMRYFWEFLGSELGLLNPVFLIAALWASIAFWRRRQEKPLWLYFFCMGAPVFFGHVAYSLHSHIMPNWIAPAVVPMFCLMVVYWDARWCAGWRGAKRWFVAGMVWGAVVIVLLHESNLIGKLAGRALPAQLDPLRRVRAWKESTAIVAAARRKLEADGKPAFLIAHHYGVTGLLTFYLPAAREAAVPLVYVRSSPYPNNQFFFWPEYRYQTNRKGQNAIYVTEVGLYQLEKGWLWKLLSGREVNLTEGDSPQPAPAWLVEEFETVADLGVYDVKLDGRVFRRLQLFECQHLR